MAALEADDREENTKEMLRKNLIKLLVHFGFWSNNSRPDEYRTMRYELRIT